MDIHLISKGIETFAANYRSFYESADIGDKQTAQLFKLGLRILRYIRTVLSENNNMFSDNPPFRIPGPPPDPEPAIDIDPERAVALFQRQSMIYILTGFIPDSPEEVRDLLASEPDNSPLPTLSPSAPASANPGMIDILAQDLMEILS